MNQVYVFGLLLISILFGAFGQICLKFGVKGGFSIQQLFSFNPYLIVGLTLYAFAMATWLIILAQTELTWLQPFRALGDIAIALLAVAILREHVTGLRWAGIILVVLGVMLVSRT
jgi:drug/metabolite transporter (DMT)-like permease